MSNIKSTLNTNGLPVGLDANGRAVSHSVSSNSGFMFYFPVILAMIPSQAIYIVFHAKQLLCMLSTEASEFILIP